MSRNPAYHGPAWLYHGTARPVTGAALTPHFNHTVSGRSGKFVFATDHADLARCYALKDERMLAAGLLDDDATAYCLILDRDAALAAPASGVVYKLPGRDFVNVAFGAYRSSEYVSNRPVALRDVEIIRVDGIDDLIDSGVQVLFTPPGVSELTALLHFRQSGYSPVRMVQSGRFIWENERRQRHMAPALVAG